eukprot:2851207-Amphidinium_carterae.1
MELQEIISSSTDPQQMIGLEAKKHIAMHAQSAVSRLSAPLGPARDHQGQHQPGSCIIAELHH